MLVPKHRRRELYNQINSHIISSDNVKNSVIMLLKHLFYKGVHDLDRIRVYHKKKKPGAEKVPAPDPSFIFLWLWLPIWRHQFYKDVCIVFYPNDNYRPVHSAVRPHSPRPRDTFKVLQGP